MTVYDAYLQAIEESWLGGLENEYIKQSLHKPDNKHGGWNGWCDGSLLVIDHEHGLTGPLEIFKTEFGTIYLSETWVSIDKRASELLGKRVFTEPFNYAISGIYEV